MLNLLFYTIICIIQIQLTFSMVDYSDNSITDDAIVASMEGLKTASVSDLIKAIEEKYKLEDIENLNLAVNCIRIIGATKLLRFLIEKLPNLEVLDLSTNKIADCRGFRKYEDFEIALKELLAKETFRSIDLSRNKLEYEDFEIALKELLAKETFRSIDLSRNKLELAWQRYMLENFPPEMIKKIILSYE